MVQRHPEEAIGLFETHLHEVQFKSKLTALMLRAAAAAGESHGAKLIRQAIHHPHVPVNFKSVGVTALGMSANLHAEGERVLHELVETPFEDVDQNILSRQAASMVANQIRRDSDPASYERGVELLMAQLASATSAQRQRNLLKGLAMRGTPKHWRSLTLFSSTKANT